MKTFLTTEQLTATVNGATIVPELARTLTRKRNGHHVTLRVTNNRVILAYLQTEMYIMPAMFNAKTKQLNDSSLNSQLKVLLGRATQLVATTLNPTDLKSGWERERKLIQQESTIAVMEQFAEWDDLTRLYAKRDTLESELSAVSLAIREAEASNGITPLTASVSPLDVKEYEKAISEFMQTLKGRSKRDQDAFSLVWDNLVKFSTHSNITLTLQSFDLDFYFKYSNFCLFVTDNYDNFFGSKVKKIKQLLKFAEEKGYKVNPGYKDRRFKVLDEKKEVVYLDESELNLVWQYKQVNPKRAKVIDCILFQALTGLRVSDTLKQHHVTTKQGERFVTGICKKNKGKFMVPLSLDSRLDEILTTRNNNMQLYSEARYNMNMKLVLTEAYAYAGLDMPQITYYRYKLGKPVEFNVPKYELISSHSMRRSFCTRHLNSGFFNETDVLQMLGSSDLKELQKYITIESTALNNKAKLSAKGKG